MIGLSNAEDRVILAGWL